LRVLVEAELRAMGLRPHPGLGHLVLGRVPPTLVSKGVSFQLRHTGLSWGICGLRRVNVGSLDPVLRLLVVPLPALDPGSVVGHLVPAVVVV
jgi:hypothetical protein